MLDGYHILTLTYRDISLEMIGNAVVPQADRPVLDTLKSRFQWDELFYLATCNRVMYLFYTAEGPAPDLPARVLEQVRPDLPAQVLAETAASMRLLHGTDAVRHLMEVAASMDSLVVGEREIIRQLREAYEVNREKGLCGDHIRLLMRFTIETAKEVYSTTGIGEKALSVVALAFNAMLAAGVRPDARVVMIGAGETNTLFGKFLQKQQFRHVTVFNRTVEKAATLAAMLGGRAFPLEDLACYREGFDVLVVCTGATEPVLTPELYARLQTTPGIKVVVDLSIPHNVAPEVVSEYDLHYIEIEGLRAQAELNLAHRARACVAAGEIIGNRIHDFRERWHERQIERALAHIPEEVKQVKERAIEAVFQKEFDRLDPAAQALVREMLGYMEKKCVAIPIKAAKAIALHAKKQQGMAEHRHSHS